MTMIKICLYENIIKELPSEDNGYSYESRPMWVIGESSHVVATTNTNAPSCPTHYSFGVTNSHNEGYFNGVRHRNMGEYTIKKIAKSGRWYWAWCE